MADFIDKERMEKIKQTEQRSVDIIKTFNIARKEIPLFIDVVADSYYISVRDYCCEILGIKYDSSLFYMPFPLTMFAIHPEDKTKTLFISLEGCKEYINSTKNSKYKADKQIVYDDFNKIINGDGSDSEKTDIDKSTNEITIEEKTSQETENSLEFKLFEELIPQETSVKNDIIPITKDTAIDVMFEPIKEYVNKLEDENKNLKEQVNNLQAQKYNYNIDMNKGNAVLKFYGECERSVNPFTNDNVLNILTDILINMKKEYSKKTAGNYHDFLNDLNNNLGVNTQYKDYINYQTEPFEKVALRLYGMNTLLYALKSEKYKEYTHHQFKNMFNINITSYPLVLKMLIMALGKKITFDCNNGCVVPIINVIDEYMSEVNDNEYN